MTPSEKNQHRHPHAEAARRSWPFITAGYPKREKFREHLTQIGNEADVVEIGVPFTDPWPTA
jgi:tryptophan synthase alpha subunit